MQNYFPWLCWMTPIVGALVGLVLDINHLDRKYQGYLGMISIGISALLAFSMFPIVIDGEIIDLKLDVAPPIELGVLIDPLSVLMAAIVSVIGFIVAVFSHGFMGNDNGLARFWFIMQVFVAGYLIVVLSDNFLFLFIGWEIVGLSVTYLTTYEYKKRKNADMGFRVNSILRIGDVALLFCILTIYAFAGTFNFIELSESSNWIVQLSNSGILLATSIFFFGGIIGKAAQFPLHEWLPDMLVGTPSSSNALTECLAGPFLMARALPIFREAYVIGYVEMTYFFLIVAWVGAITGLVTALTATAQRHPQRIMAYSISSIIGFMLAAFGLAGLNSKMVSGYLAGTTLLLVDAFVSALLILSTVLVSYAVGSEDVFSMWGYKSKIAHHGMEVAVFAMISIPPFSGFWLCNWVQSLSLELSGQAYQAGNSLLVNSGYALFGVLILTGCITAFYGLRLMGLIFQKGRTKRKIASIPRSMLFSYISLLIMTMILDLAVPVLIPLLNKYFWPITGDNAFHNVFDFLKYIIPSMSTLMTVFALFVGGQIAYQHYFVRSNLTEKIMNFTPFLSSIHSFLLKRCYIEVIYGLIGKSILSISKRLYKTVEMEGIRTFKIKGISEFFGIAMKWSGHLSRWIYPFIEVKFFGAIDKKLSYVFMKVPKWMYPSVEITLLEGLNKKIVEVTEKLSHKVRETYTGILSINVLFALIGVVLAAFILIMFRG